MLRNGDEITSPSRRIDLGQITATTLAFGYPSPPSPSGWVWTLPDICVINIKHHHLADWPCPAHNKAWSTGTAHYWRYSLEAR